MTYDDVKQQIIDALVGREAGTEIQPEAHQEAEIAILDYVRNIELTTSGGLMGVATATTVPYAPSGSRVAYLAVVSMGTSVTFTNFRDSSGQSITVTAGSAEAVLAIFIWDGSAWSVSTMTFSMANNIVQTIGTDTQVAISQAAMTRLMPWAWIPFQRGGIDATGESTDDRAYVRSDAVYFSDLLDDETATRQVWVRIPNNALSFVTAGAYMATEYVGEVPDLDVQPGVDGMYVSFTATNAFDNIRIVLTIDENTAVSRDTRRSLWVIGEISNYTAATHVGTGGGGSVELTADVPSLTQRGGAYTVTVSSTGRWSVLITGDATLSETSGTGDATLTLTIGESAGQSVTLTFIDSGGGIHVYTIPVAYVTVEGLGATISTGHAVDFTVTANVGWTLETMGDITVSPTSGLAGTTAMTLVAGDTEGTGILTFTDILGGVTVVTVAVVSDLCTLTIVPSVGGASVAIDDVQTSTVTVTKGTTVQWQVWATGYGMVTGSTVVEETTQYQWVKLEPKTAVVTVSPTPSWATVTVNGAEGTEVEVPTYSTAEIIVSASGYIPQTVTRYVQEENITVAVELELAPVEPYFYIEPSSLSFPADTELTAVLQISSNVDWTIQSLDSWIAVSPTSGTGDATVTVTVESNSGAASSRTGTLVVTNSVSGTQNIYVYQAEEIVSYLTVSPTNIDYIYIGGKAIIVVDSNTAWVAAIDYDGKETGWLTLSSTSGSSSGNIILTASAWKGTTAPRTATVTFTNEYGNTATVAVTQDYERYLRVTPTSINAEGDGGEFTVEIETNEKWTAEASD